MNKRLLVSLEFVITLVLIFVIAFVAIAKLSSETDRYSKEACKAYESHIDGQVKIWFYGRGSYPKSDLSDIGRNKRFFPEGLPKCPVDGSSYKLDPVSHKVVPHTY